MNPFNELCDRAERNDLRVGLHAHKGSLSKITLTTKGKIERGTLQIDGNDYDKAAFRILEKHEALLS